MFGPGLDQPLVEYAGSGTTSRTFLSADERGSIIARSASTGALIAANSYDEYGIPGSANAGLFQYTGQAWISQLGFYYYKARMYSPTLGRFMQTDPLGYGGDGPNLYAYVLNDPVNFGDPLGLCTGPEGDIVVCGKRLSNDSPVASQPAPVVGTPPSGPGGGCVGDCRPIVVTATKKKTPPPELVVAGKLTSVGANLGSLALHANAGDGGAVAGDIGGIAAGFVPGGGTITRKLGVDLSRDAAGRWVKGRVGRYAAQNEMVKIAQAHYVGTIAGSLGGCKS